MTRTRVPKRLLSQLNTAADYMITNVPIVSDADTIREVEILLEQRTRHFVSINYIYVTDAVGVLTGVLSIKELFAQSPETLVSSIAKRSVVTVQPDTNRERVALTALQQSIKAVPVVDGRGRLIGVVPAGQIIAMLHTKRVEDALRHAGSGGLDNPLVTIVSGSPWLHVRTRLPWLIVGLLGGLLAAYVVRLFEATLAEQVLVAAFIPTVMYMSDAVGSQTEIIFIRALALEQDFRFWPYFRREVVVNLVIAVVLGVLMLLACSWWLLSITLGFVLGLSIVVTVALSMLIALLVPYAFVRLGYDPAVTSGPFVTIVRDILSLLVYLLIVVLLL